MARRRPIPPLGVPHQGLGRRRPSSGTTAPVTSPVSRRRSHAWCSIVGRRTVGVMTRPDPETAALAAARRFLDSLAGRAAVGEAVGVLQGWRGCDAAQALRDLAGSTGAAGLGVEAARVAALVDARADGTADPDYGGWT